MAQPPPSPRSPPPSPSHPWPFAKLLFSLPLVICSGSLSVYWFGGGALDLGFMGSNCFVARGAWKRRETGARLKSPAPPAPPSPSRLYEPTPEKEWGGVG